jgi:hypothetical protein
MRQSKCVPRVLMGGILSVTLAGLVPVVYAQVGAAVPAARREGLPPAAARQDLQAWAPQVLRQTRARVRRPADR